MSSRVTDPLPPALRQGIDSSTLLVAALIYGGWIALTLTASRLPLLLVAIFGGWLLAWHGSLQHETIHGHPTSSQPFWSMEALDGIWSPRDSQDCIRSPRGWWARTGFPIPIWKVAERSFQRLMKNVPHGARMFRSQDDIC